MTGFEDYEVVISRRMREEVVPELVTYLKRNANGYDHRIYAKELELLVASLMPELSPITLGPVLRACIKYIRYKWLIIGLVSSQKGYWIATSPEEMFNYEKKIYQSYIGQYNLFKSLCEARREKFPDYVPTDADGNILEWIDD